jgi:hypothetical protein
MRLLQEIAPLAALVAIACFAPQLGARWFRSAERLLARLARRRTLSIGLVTLLALAISAGVSLLVQMPHPWGHDEFSYLLAADTFSHGRLTNPPHPLWMHFESFHIIQQPSYASKYPPAQGLMLAAGQVIGGNPVVGLWIGTALAYAAICWMLMAWMPPRWALLGGLLAVVHPVTLLWSQRYWGAAVAVLGGALVLGASRRMVAHVRARDALWMTLGIALLINSRPYEGTVLSALAVLPLLKWTTSRDRPPMGAILGHAALPVTVVLALTVAAMGYYNYRVTGNPFCLPYLLHEQQYGIAPPFVWQEPRPEPVYHHAVMRDFHRGLELGNYAVQRSLQGFASACLKKLAILAEGVFPATVLGITLLAGLILFVPVPWMLRDRWMRWAILTGVVFITTLLPESWMNVHYAAPAFGLAFILGMRALRHLRLWHWRGKPCGIFLVRAGILLCLASVIPTAAQLARLDREKGWAIERAQVLVNLKRTGERHLIIVRYEPMHSPDEEWVYNGADIDSAPVVWAREMDAEQNRKLFTYFADRRVWLLEADATPRRLVPYPMPAGL